MQQYIIPVNNEALSRALVAVVGEDNAALITKAYQAIDAAMAFGFQQGAEQARASSNSYWETQLAQAKEAADMAGFKRGYNEGFNNSEDINVDDVEDAFDDGYIEGVADARTRPEQADDYIAYLCRLDEDAYETAGIEHTYDGDSGDETDYSF